MDEDRELDEAWARGVLGGLTGDGAAKTDWFSLRVVWATGVLLLALGSIVTADAANHAARVGGSLAMVAGGLVLFVALIATAVRIGTRK